eukprot:scaffold6364_cov171-Amphora_coffeaeformis.AAC.1
MPAVPKEEDEKSVMQHSKTCEGANHVEETDSMEVEAQPDTAVPTASAALITEETPLPPTSPGAATTAVPLSEAIYQRSLFAVGDVVQVQARTWPGANLHGGVGRIKAVHLTGQHHVSYDIDYVLGGRERKVDAVFCSTTDLPRTGRRRTSVLDGGGAASRRLEQKQREGVLPPTLLAQLRMEGFDVEGKIEPAFVAVNTPAPTTTSVTTRHKSHNNSNKKETKTPKSSTATANRKRKSTETTETNSKPKKRRAGESILAHVANLGRKRAAAVAPVPVKLTDPQACLAADQKYQERFQKAIQKSTVSLAVSSLSAVDTKRVETLCKQSKNIRVKLSNNISKQTTVCIIPADESDPTMARTRTAKAMRAALLGIPLVTPAWVESCLSKGDVSAPTAAYCLRGLPTKSGDKAGGPCGAAHLAAHSTGLLQNYQIHLCVPSKMQADVVQLVKDAGGTITARLAPPKNGQPLMVLCGDTDHNVGGAVQKAITKNPQQYQVVHMRWLFDSISRGSPEPNLSLYDPPASKAKALWQLCCAGRRTA